MAGADLRAPLVASCLRGALPPVDLRAVCFVRAMVRCSVDKEVVKERPDWKQMSDHQTGGKADGFASTGAGWRFGHNNVDIFNQTGYIQTCRGA